MRRDAAGPNPRFATDGLAPALEATARAWVVADPDAVTQSQLDVLIEHAKAGAPDAINDLSDRFSGRLKFGTAGLRAELGAGPMRMNRVVVRQAAAGLMRFLDPGSTVIIGYDARHNSDVFARDTARVVAAAGGRAGNRACEGVG